MRTAWTFNEYEKKRFLLLYKFFTFACTRKKTTDVWRKKGKRETERKINTKKLGNFRRRDWKKTNVYNKPNT